jgi:hypothetical protein
LNWVSAIDQTKTIFMKPSSQSLVLKCFGLFFVSVAVFSSCKKDMLPIGDQPVVLVAGSESNGKMSVAKYWINGQEVMLSDGNNNAEANSIIASGNNIYVAGNDGGAVYWKNNKEIRLPHIGVSDAFANSIFASGNDVYVAGFDGGAVYWKNNTEIRLPGSFASSIFVSGRDVYVAGSDGKNAVYWKNGEEVVLSNAVYGASANSIFVVGSNVYAAGTIYGPIPQPMYWKNGIGVAERPGDAESIFVSGSDVYVAGRQTDDLFYTARFDAVYWKNGEVEKLTYGAPSYGHAYSIYVSRNDVYTAGSYSLGTQGAVITACYWKNTTKFDLTNGSRPSIALSIFVK